VIEVVVNDPQISDTGEGKGEPDVTLNGKQLRMVQATDGNWYAYFANVQKAKIADQIAFDTGVSGEGLDFGVFCSSSTPSSALGVIFSDSDGVAVPRIGSLAGFTNGNIPFSSCSGVVDFSSSNINNVVRQPKSINTNSPAPGQIGLETAAWPIIQLFSFDDVEIQYNRAGGVQKVELDFDEIEDASLALDRTTYPQNSQVFIIINDIQLNQDPTSNDSWTFNINSPNAVFYQAFDENGNDAANGTPALQNLVPFLSSLGFKNNGLLSGNLGSVAELRTNDNQPDSSVSDGSTTFSQIITLVESEPNSAVFESFDDSDQSTIGTKIDAPRGQTATVSYNSKSYSILSGTSTGSVTMDSDLTTLQPGHKQTVEIKDPDQNLNSGTREHLDVFRSSAIIPSLQIGQPLTLEKSSSVQFYPTSLSDLEAGGTSFQSSVPDKNSDRLIIDTRPQVSPFTFEKISFNLGHSASDFQSLFINVDPPSSDGTNWINYDLRSFQRQLDLSDFSDTSIAFYFGLDDLSPITIVDSGDISSAQGLIQIDDSDIDDLNSKSGTAFLVINFDSSNNSASVGTISSEIDTQPIVVDFFSFGFANSQEVNNAIYRLELEETTDNSGIFSGTIEYSVTNQLNFFDPSFVQTLQTIKDDVKFLVNDRLIDEKGIAIKYSDIATVGTGIGVSTKTDILTHSGTVGLSSQSLRLGHPVSVVLNDPDLNLDKDTIESYFVIDDPNSPAVDTVGDSSGNSLLEVMIKGVRYKRCTIDGVEHGGLASTGFTLTETNPSSGVFEGVFRLPIRICNESGTALISPAGGSVELKYFDFRDSFGEQNIFTTGRLSSSEQPSSPSLNAEKFILPKYKETIEVIISGKIANYKQGTQVNLILEHPDKTIQPFNLFATSQGSYKGAMKLEHDSKPGVYTISVEYLGNLQGSASFTVVKHVVPEWIKNNAAWWSSDAISDGEFIGGIEHLIKEEIILIPETNSSLKSEKTIPPWIKNTAKWWSDDLISDDEFVSALEFLVKEGIIRV
ncbi:MAG: peptidase, partial [Nitrosopumilaceae archaeon]